MDQWVGEIVKQAPSLGVLAFIVVKFLQLIRSNQQVMQVIDSKHRELHVRTLDCIDKNTEVLGQVKETIARSRV